MVLLISYDLKGHERPSAYQDVKRVIENNAIDYKRPLYSQWFVETSASVDTWADRLTKVIDSNDKLFICEVKGHTNGWLPKDVWEWLNARVRSYA
jgi:hypothetical protein